MEIIRQTDEDVYAYEEEQEKVAMVKALHQPMKLWYNSEHLSSLREKYGDFPQFYRDLLLWPHWRIIQKLYLHITDSHIDLSESNILDIEKKILSRSQIETIGHELGTSEKNSLLTEDKNQDNNSSVANATEEKKQKRRNRWGDAPSEKEKAIENQEKPTTEQVKGADENDEGEKKKRRSRWSATTPTDNSTGVTTGNVPPLIPAIPSVTAPPLAAALTPEIIQQTLVLQMQLKSCNDKLLTVVQDALVIEQDPNRSPSPPPKYDANGKRTNTREVRMRESLMATRQKVIEELIKLNPLFQPPPDFVKTKPFRRHFIPLKEYPTYNFIGLIIGPRGNTQKRMERETGCKISIRGKGSVKEGSKGRANKNVDEDEELHVYVTGDTEEQVEMASKMVQELLVPVDDDKNEHKQKQLKELALINGTLREEDFCQVCGEKGHRQFECPHRTKTFQAAGVKCAICGDKSHPTRDCPFKEEAPTNAVALDDEYNSFMAELGDGQKPEVEPNGSASVKVDGAGPSTQAKKPKQTVITLSHVMTGATPPMPYPGMSGISPSNGVGAAAPFSGYPPAYPYGAYPPMPMPGMPMGQYPPVPNPWGMVPPGAAVPGYPVPGQQMQQPSWPLPMPPAYGQPYDATALVPQPPVPPPPPSNSSTYSIDTEMG